MSATSHSSLRLLQCYQSAMRSFDPDLLADLYVPAGVHEFGFLTPGPSRLEGREQIRQTYRLMWQRPRVTLGEIRNVAIHSAKDTEVLINEWRATASPSNGALFEISGVLVLTSSEGKLTHVRDYMDLLSLAQGTGTYEALARALDQTHGGD